MSNPISRRNYLRSSIRLTARSGLILLAVFMFLLSGCNDEGLTGGRVIHTDSPPDQESIIIAQTAPQQIKEQPLDQTAEESPAAGPNDQEPTVSAPPSDPEIPELDLEEPQPEPVGQVRLLAEDTLADVVEEVIDAIVNVSAKKMVAENHFPGRRNPYWEQLEKQPKFQPDNLQKFPEYGSGSGVIISGDGLILTSAHIVEEAQEITIALRGGEKYTAKLLGTDPQTDLALLSIAAGNLKPITLGNSEKIRIGQIVLAIGNPFRFGHSVSMGIISAKGRSGSALFGNDFYASFLQTDAAINPGNSGGALIDLSGRLIGINTAIASRSGGSQGIGLAVPIDLAKKILPRLKSHGKVTRGWIGIGIQNLSAELAGALNYNGECGVLVNKIFAGSPGDLAGIKAGDIISTYNGTPMCDLDQLRNAASLTEIGRTVPVIIFRNGQTMELPVTIQEIKTTPVVEDEPDEELKTIEIFGIVFIENDPSPNKNPDVKESLVTALTVKPGSQGDEAGVKPGDVVISVAGKPIVSLDQLTAMVDGAKDASLLFLIRTKTGSYFHPFKIEDDLKSSEGKLPE